jgi:Uma2 family endonuclease
MGEPYWGVPDLVMEVVSPGTRRVDAVIKAKEYAEAGIPEYWLVDPEAEAVVVYILGEAGYGERQVHESGDMVRSAILRGFVLSVDDVLAAP